VATPQRHREPPPPGGRDQEGRRGRRLLPNLHRQEGRREEVVGQRHLAQTVVPGRQREGRHQGLLEGGQRRQQELLPLQQPRRRPDQRS
jgi:hypothetical protein